MSVIGVGKHAGSTTKTAEVTCHACPANTSVRYKHPDEIADYLAKRGWDITRGVIAYHTHSYVTMLPRKLRHP